MRFFDRVAQVVSAVVMGAFLVSRCHCFGCVGQVGSLSRLGAITPWSPASNDDDDDDFETPLYNTPSSMNKSPSHRVFESVCPNSSGKDVASRGGDVVMKGPLSKSVGKGQQQAARRMLSELDAFCFDHFDNTCFAASFMMVWRYHCVSFTSDCYCAKPITCDYLNRCCCDCLCPS